VEGILRTSAGVDEVDKRLQEYEQGYMAILYLVHRDFCFWNHCAYDLICMPVSFILGRTEFAPDEDAHVVGDCVKVSCPNIILYIDSWMSLSQ
jgi:hypothetical protein